MADSDFTSISTARDQVREAFTKIDAAAETLRDGGLNDLAHDLELAAGGLRHFAGPDGVMAWVEKGDAE